MKKIIISIIIPVYNAEKFLDNCIGSVVNQTYKNLEIIIINDGSTDNSERIIKKWKYSDGRIKYIKQSNLGVAEARNKGMVEAQGEYIFFIDSDDTLKLDAIETLVSHCKRSATDIVLGNYFIVEENKTVKSKSLISKVIESSNIDSTNTKVNMFLFNGRPLATVWNKLYKTSFLKKYNLRFIGNVFAEDRLFNLMCFVNNSSITVVNEYTYFYNIIDNSRSRKFRETFFDECVALLHTLYSYLENKSILGNNQDLLEITVVYEIDNILSYYYNHFKSIGSIKEAISLIQSDKLLHNIIRKINKDKTLNKITKNKKNFIRMNLIIKFYLYMPKIVTATFYWLYKKISVLR